MKRRLPLLAALLLGALLPAPAHQPLYLVNGVSPGYSASEYTLKPGDRVEWVYTCDMGQDVGASAAGAGT